MAGKVIFVLVIGLMAIAVSVLACTGWIYGFAWWRRKEYCTDTSS